MVLDLDIISKYDGLLLVHPEWFAYPGEADLEGIEQVYDNFKRAQAYCEQHEVPFMVGLSSEGYMRQFSPISEVGLDDGYHEIKKSNIVRNVASIVGKPSKELSILFGGFKADACVSNWVANLCTKIEYDNENPGQIPDWIDGSQFWKKPEKFENGRIHYGLTDRILQ